MRPLHILFALLIVAIWGANFTVIRIGLDHFPPFALTALRFALVAAFLVPFVPRPKPLGKILFLSVIFGTVHFGLVFGGMSHGLDIASLVIIAQLGVPFACILSAILLKDRLGPLRIIGLLVAFAGVMVIAGTPRILQHLGPFLLAVIGTFCWGYSNILMKQIGEVAILPLLGWVSLFAVPQLMLVSWIFEGNSLPLLMTINLKIIASLLFTALGATIIAYGLWYHLLRIYPISKVTPFSLLVPIFGIIAGQFFYPQPITWQLLVGGALTIAGVAIITLRRPKLVEYGKGVV